MSYGVSNHVQQGVSKRREHVRVHANVSPERFKPHFFLEGLGRVSNRSLKQRKDGGRGQQSQTIGCIAHLRKLGFHLVYPRNEAARKAFQVAAKLLCQSASFRIRIDRSRPVGSDFRPLRQTFEQNVGELSRSFRGFELLPERG
jgi:hypothetical protein